jgi:ABC-2 type transport system ATP-binding protein
MLRVDRVSKGFGKVQAVRDVSFTIAPGITFGLLGPNGAGKTTTMRMIAGIYQPDRGTVTWNDRRIDSQARRRFGYLPEERGLYGTMTTRDQIMYFGRLHGVHDPHVQTRTDALIERLGLGEYTNRRCGELSKGNQQKVQMACAAVHEPELLILDEPFSGLDPVNAETLLEILTEMKQRGTTVVLSSHQMWQLELLCDEFCIITDGENRASGTLAQLRADWPTRVIKVQPVSGALRAVLDRVPQARMLQSNGALLYEIPAGTPLPPLLRELVQTDGVTRFETLDPSLQEIYLHTIGAPSGRAHE